jgi:hypothetical protein
MATWQFENEETGIYNVPAGGYHISTNRIIVMSIISFGLYWLYWMYRTWQPYRYHHDGNAYPFWHGLTQLVPIYGFFRFHAHVRTYKELIQERGVPNTLNVGGLTAIVVIVSVAEWVIAGFNGYEGFPLVVEVIFALANLVVLAIGIAIIVRVQNNINLYWVSVDDRFGGKSRFGKGEVLIVVLGILIWLVIIADLIW